MPVRPDSPMLKLHQQAEAMLAPWGPPDGVKVVQTFGELELEYAAIRKASGLFDAPHRAVLEVAGSERHAFLNRMLTQELKGLKPREVRRSFWLNRKGRIDADLAIFETGASILMDVDVAAAARTLDGLSAFIIADDVAIADVSDRIHRLSLHGPTGPLLLDDLGTPTDGASPVSALAPGAVTSLTFDLGDPDHEAPGAEPVWIARDDAAGEWGLELFVPAAQTYALYRRLLEAGTDPGLTIDGSKPTLGHRARLRPIGWHAFNIARIEAGTPIYNIDFSDESLPAETGILDRRVSFTKGCYLGQEIVARMHARGHPKQILAALRVTPPPHARDRESGLPFMPVSGAAVFALPAGVGPADFRADQAEPIGVITSSTLAPMLSAAPICFAQIKWGHHEPGAAHIVMAEGVPSPATIQPDLVFWRRDADPRKPR